MNNLAQSVNNESLTRIWRSLILSPKAAKIVSWVLLLLIVYIISIFGWAGWELFQPRQTVNIESASNNPTNNQSKSTDIRQLTVFNLFGDAQFVQSIPDSNLIDAPVTRLKLKLRGVYAASEVNLAGAMIEAQNKQDVYRIGDKLPGASGLKLHKIIPDRVIMSRNGKFETLIIEDFGQIPGLSVTNNDNIAPVYENRNVSTSDEDETEEETIIDKRSDEKLSSELLDLRSKLSDPKSLSELISVTPAIDGDEFQGFRLAPGKDRALFGRLGLRRNDVVTEINGIRLDDPSSAFSLMEQISSAEEINLTIKRGDKAMSILFSAQSQ